LLSAFALAAFVPGLAGAQQAPPPPAERALVYSSYEQETIDEVLASLHDERDPAPEGKMIERIEVVPLDVFEPRDVAQIWKGILLANLLHVRSRAAVIRRELLLGEGDPYAQVLADETIRNLRRLPQLSAILVVATKGATADRVRVVVITKDVWSLRLNWNATLTPGGLELFEAQPAEWNFLGTHQELSGHFVYRPDWYTFGLGYVAPRLGTSRVAIRGGVDVIVNRHTGAADGTLGSLVAGQPLYSPQAEWAWDASVSWENRIVPRYSDATLVVFGDHFGKVPWQYRARSFVADYELRRSFGWETKHDFAVAVGIDNRRYLTDFPGADRRTVQDFIVQAKIPVSDTRVGPAIQYHTYTKRYLRVIDFDTLALQEDYALGHDVVLQLSPSFRALGGTRDVLSLYGAVQYTVAVRDGLFRVSFASRTEPEVDRIADAAVQPTAHLVSPSVLGLGRVVFDATFLYRWRNYLSAHSTLGGADRLRGYPTNFFDGWSYVSSNVEFRSRPVEILSCELSGVAFYDAGDAFYGSADFHAYQSLGVGLRALFPWLDRVVFRADVGIPIERPLTVYGTPIAPVGFVVSFGQALAVPTVSPAPVLPTGQ
jgi:hypothetical protein